MDEPEIFRPEPATSLLTRVTAHVRLGRGVVGNTTFGFWGACLLALGICIALTVCGYPNQALYALGMCMVFYLLYQVTTWVGVAYNTDAGMSGDEHYASVVATRQSARNPTLVVKEFPQLRGTGHTEESGAHGE